MLGRIISIPGLYAAFLAGVNQMALNGASTLAIIVSLPWIRRHAMHQDEEEEKKESQAYPPPMEDDRAQMP